MTARHIRVLIADDSLVAREMLSQILSSDPHIEVVGQACDGDEAVKMVAELKPDLVTMDIHMPGLDGLAATEQIMAYNPTPILVVSSSVYAEGMGRAFDALELGALEVIKKPEPRDWADLDRIARDVIRKVRILSNVRVITHIGGRQRRAATVPVRRKDAGATRSIVAIGSSTGGPSALMSVLSRMPKAVPAPIVVAQHIADGFVAGLVGWLNSGCELSVVAASQGVRIQPGTVYFAPTGSNLVVDGDELRFRKPGPDQLYIPSADTLFDSVAGSHGASALGVIMTGMGADGAKGLKRMHEAGAVTIAQDEATCTVYGMPRAAVELGAAQHVVPLDELAEKIQLLVAR